MIHVNVRGLLVRKSEGEIQLIIQLRKRAGDQRQGGIGRENECQPADRFKVGT